ncbi:MAG: hypothetical protein DI538_06160 [Azospira oryzae]|nr:MAG: hypothetical protein DI538_06160 [Azospira oryzae]
MLSFQFRKNDHAVEETLATIKKYVEFADMSQKLTTFYGTSPFEPGISNNVKGKPFTLNEKGFRVYESLNNFEDEE